jgi:hypothetical protein
MKIIDYIEGVNNYPRALKYFYQTTIDDIQ